MNAVIQENQFDRSGYIGSSDAASILGVSPWKSPLALYQEKIGEYSEEITPEKQKIFNRGKKFEPLILEMLIEELTGRGHDVEIIARNERLRDPEYHFIASESDMVLSVDGEIISAEAKSVNGFASKLWGKPETDDFPIYYQCQTMHDLMVKGRKKCVVAALIGTDDLRIHWIKRHEEIIQAIRTKEVEFWNRVQNREPPEPVSADDISRLYQFDSGLTIEATEKIVEFCRDLKAIKASIKQSETREEMISTQIKVAMKEASLVIHNNQKLVTWKTNKSSTKINWEKAFRAIAMDYAQNSKDDIQGYINSATTTIPGARPFLIKG